MAVGCRNEQTPVAGCVLHSGRDLPQTCMLWREVPCLLQLTLRRSPTRSTALVVLALLIAAPSLVGAKTKGAHGSHSYTATQTQKSCGEFKYRKNGKYEDARNRSKIGRHSRMCAPKPMRAKPDGGGIHPIWARAASHRPAGTSLARIGL